MAFFKKFFARTKPADDPPVASFHEYASKIFPWVKVSLPEGDGASLKLTDGDAPVSRPWLGNLHILYAEDAGNYFRVLQRQDLPEGFTDEQLHQMAVINLSKEVAFELHKSHLGFYGLVAGGNHEAGAICLPGLWKQLAAELNDNLVVTIPAKDLLLFSPESDEAGIFKMKESAAALFATAEKALTKTLFKYHKEVGDWSVL
ncbi:DUF1444 family protein [Chitinophaga sp.]|uniref:DUF1444 family protein n=1 Tax=Chitinophaga sp. TaxID=1869181 RepID=UPI002F9447B1